MTVMSQFRLVSQMNGLWEDGKIDPDRTLYIGPSKADVFRSCPYADTDSYSVQAVGFVEDEVVGKINYTWYNIVADGKKYKTVTGEGLFVYEKFRHTMYGVRLLDGLKKLTPDKVIMGCRYSALAQKVIAALGYHIFPLRHYYLIRHSKRFVGNHLPSVLCGAVSSFVDKAFWIQNNVLMLKARFETRDIVTRVIDWSDAESLEQVAELVKKDKHRFREDITSEWLLWVGKHDFCEGVTKKILGFYKQGNLIGFALSRWRDSDTGHGELLEWQFDSKYKDIEPALVMRALQLLLKHCDHAMLMFDENNKAMSEYFNGKLLRRKDDLVAVLAAPGSPLRNHAGYDVALNWRIRPAMGDSCFW